MRDLLKYGKDYNVPNFEDYQAKYRKKKILSILSEYKPQTILEIGCGMDPLFPYIDWNYKKMVIIEPCLEFFNHTQSIISDKKIECYNEYFHKNEILKSLSFDFIVCSSLLHEVNNPLDFFKNIAAISAKDTIVHISVPNANSIHRLIAKEIGYIDDVHQMSDRNKLYQQNTVYDIDSLKELARAAGFNVLDEGSFFIKPFSHDQMYKMIKQEIIEEKVLDGLYALEKYIPLYGSEIYLNLKIKE